MSAAGSTSCTASSATAAARAYRGDRDLHLSLQELRVLRRLVDAAGAVLTVAELWPEPTTSLHTVIERIRHKLDRRGRPLLFNVPGQGYYLAPRRAA